MATDELLAERGKTHGKFSDHAMYTQQLKGYCVLSKNWDELNYSQRESLDMICHKIGRILAGNHREPDHWNDIAGYARLVAQQLEGKNP